MRFDVIVVGGALTSHAALQRWRARWDVLVIDAGEPREIVSPVLFWLPRLHSRRTRSWPRRTKRLWRYPTAQWLRQGRASTALQAGAATYRDAGKTGPRSRPRASCSPRACATVAGTLPGLTKR